MQLQNKKIILAITGSIAAYKAATLCRLLIKAGAEVQVLMTAAAEGFITPLTMATLSKRPVFSSVHSESSWNNHVELGLWADAMVVAPATATTLSKMVTANCDNIVTAVYLSARCPVFFAPAMDLDMWHHAATQRNVRQLQADGNLLIPVGTGELASGLNGDGRMAEPEDIVAHLAAHFAQSQALQGIQMLITAGPTYEAIDPVRFIGNRSSGKMGVAIAEAAAAAGAMVQLVLGPSRLSPTHPNITVSRVQSAQEMYEAASLHFAESQVTVLSAAVADYRPSVVANEKIKKKEATFTLNLEKTTDIAASLGAQKRNNQLIVGFALETNDEILHAKGKLHKKNFDFVVLNSLQDAGAGFNHDTNKIAIISKDESIKEFPLKSKTDVASDIIQEIISHLSNLSR